MSDLFNPPFIIAILAALTIHECAHAFVANYLGDPTAKNEGRVTLNPIAHLDPIGTLLFFIVHFGWGKPVPVDPRYFRHPKRDSALVALAGPASNLLLAIVSFALLAALAPQTLHVTSAENLLFAHGIGERLQAFASQVFANMLFINLALMAFNLLPIAPLDGSKVLHPFIPLRYEEQYDRFMQNGPYILIGLLVAERLFDIPILFTWINAIINSVLFVMMSVV